MLDLGGWELLLIAILTILVFGPKELPTVVRTVSKWMGFAKGMARDFQSGLDDIAREAELDELKKTVAEVQSIDIEDALDMKDRPSGENTIGAGSDTSADDMNAFDVPDQPEFPSDEDVKPEPNIDVTDLEVSAESDSGQPENETTTSAGAKA